MTHPELFPEMRPSYSRRPCRCPRFRGGTFDAGPRAYVDFDPAEVFGAAGDWAQQRKKRNSLGSRLRGEEGELCGSALLGTWAFCIHSGPRCTQRRRKTSAWIDCAFGTEYPPFGGSSNWGLATAVCGKSESKRRKLSLTARRRPPYASRLTVRSQRRALI